jgi:hypothetical protein
MRNLLLGIAILLLVGCEQEYPKYGIYTKSLFSGETLLVGVIDGFPLENAKVCDITVAAWLADEQMVGKYAMIEGSPRFFCRKL